MGQELLTVVTRKGQITVPAAIRRALKIQEGDKIAEYGLAALIAGGGAAVAANFAVTTTNLTGHPQVAVPCGFVDGLPRALSFIGKLYDEGSPLRVALAYERASGWTRKHPRLEDA